MSTRQLALPLVRFVVVWLRDRCLSPPHSSAAGNRAGPEVIRVRDLDLPFVGCNTQENKPCILPGKQGRAGPGSEVASEPAPKASRLPISDTTLAQIKGFELAYPNIHSMDPGVH